MESRPNPMAELMARKAERARLAQQARQVKQARQRSAGVPRKVVFQARFKRG